MHWSLFFRTEVRRIQDGGAVRRCSVAHCSCQLRLLSGPLLGGREALRGRGDTLGDVFRRGSHRRRQERTDRGLGVAGLVGGPLEHAVGLGPGPDAAHFHDSAGDRRPPSASTIS